jgi:hypothetical protein
MSISLLSPFLMGTICIRIYLNLHPLHLDSPGPGGFVQDVLHKVTDGLPLRKDLSQGLESKYSRRVKLMVNLSNIYTMYSKEKNAMC